MKESILSLSLLLVFAAVSTQAQITPISVPAGGIPPLTFAVAPTLADGWSTYSHAGSSTTLGDATAVDNWIQTQTASAFITPLGTSATAPPSANAVARYNVALGLLQTRPTGNAGCVLMASLKNDTGATVAEMTASYDTEMYNPATEQIPGLRVYFSTTGAAGSWTLIPEFSDGVVGSKTATLNLGSWAPLTTMYIIWFDDNSDGSTDPSWTIDNVKFAPANAGPVAPAIIDNTLPLNTVVAERATVTLTTKVSGTTLAYQWFYNSIPIPNQTNYNLIINYATPGVNGVYYCIASNQLGKVITRTATLTVTPDVIPPYLDTAVALGSMTEILVNFSEAGGLDLVTALNRTNYSVFPVAGGASIQIVAVTNTTLVQTRLTLASPLVNGVQYYLAVRNIKDRAYTPNIMFPWQVVITVPEIAGSDVVLYNWDQTWAYNTNGIDLGTEWRVPSYDDSSWPSGPGWIGYETTAFAEHRTKFPMNPLVLYARTKFTPPADLPNSLIIISNVVDDGAVFYLNGVEIPNSRFNMTNSPTINFSDLALKASTEFGSSGFQFHGIVFRSSLLMHGAENVLAVEIHQNSVTSSDILFGSRMIARPIVPIVIAAPLPETLSADAGASLTLSVTATGSITSYEWTFNETPIVGANASSYTITNLSAATAGDYAVVVAGPEIFVPGGTTSVTINKDTVKPYITAAEYYSTIPSGLDYSGATAGKAFVYIWFNEPVQYNSAMNVGSYQLSDGDAMIPIESAMVTSNNSLVILTVGAGPGWLINYALSASGVTDLAGNPCANTSTNSVTPRVEVEIIPFFYPWMVNDSGKNLGTAWKEWNYAPLETDGWRNTNITTYALFGLEDNTTIPGNINTPLALTNNSGAITTYYFRTSFDMPPGFNTEAAMAGISLQIMPAIDDGAAFYLNGNWIGSFFMPPTWNAATFANNHEVNENLWYTAPRSDILRVPASGLKPTGNILAVEVHNTSITSGDILFGLRLSTIQMLGNRIPPAVTQNPTTIHTNAGAEVTLRANATGVPAPSYAWYFNGTNKLECTTTNLVLNNVQWSDSGNYSFVAFNDNGAATSTVASLVVTQKPVFTVEPQSQTNGIGTTVTLSADTYGSQPTTYRWYWNGAPMLNQTNKTLVIVNAQLGNSGNFYIVANNIGGSVTSKVATVLVTGCGCVTAPWLPNPPWPKDNGNTFSVKVPSAVGSTYVLQYTDSLNPLNWRTLTNTTVSGDGTIKSLLDTSATVPQRFYRVKVN